MLLRSHCGYLDHVFWDFSYDFFLPEAYLKALRIYTIYLSFPEILFCFLFSFFLVVPWGLFCCTWNLTIYLWLPKKNFFFKLFVDFYASPRLISLHWESTQFTCVILRFFIALLPPWGFFHCTWNLYNLFLFLWELPSFGSLSDINIIIVLFYSGNSILDCVWFFLFKLTGYWQTVLFLLAKDSSFI